MVKKLLKYIDNFTITFNIVPILYFNGVAAEAGDHTFEKYLDESEVVKIFWVIGLFMSLLALIYGVWL